MEKLGECIMTFGARLKKLRIEHDLQSGEIAKILRIAKSTYSGYENDKSKPDYKTLIELASYYSVSVDYLLGNSGKQHPYAPGSTTAEEVDQVITIEKFDEKNILGKRLKVLRKERRMTQDELGAAIKKTKFNISNYERGNRQPNIYTLRLIAEYFQVSSDYLIGISDLRVFSDSQEQSILRLGVW
jgi:transcriptional regulator with XRE-family HTH domain